MSNGNGRDQVVDLVNAKAKLEAEIQKGETKLGEQRVTLAAINARLTVLEKEARR